MRGEEVMFAYLRWRIYQRSHRRLCKKLVKETEVLELLRNASVTLRPYSNFMSYFRHAVNSYWAFAHRTDFARPEFGLSNEEVRKNIAELRSAKQAIAYLYNLLLSLNATKTDPMIRLMSTGPDLVWLHKALQKLEHDFKNSIPKLRYCGLFDHRMYHKAKFKEPFLTGFEPEYYALTNAFYARMRLISLRFLKVSLQAQIIWRQCGKT